MDWKRRIDTRQNDMAHGITFVMYERSGEKIRSEVAIGPKKVHTDGTISVTLALDQHKYGDELIFQLFTRENPKIFERRADGWNRIQIYGGNLDLDTADMLIALATEIRNRVLSRS